MITYRYNSQVDPPAPFVLVTVKTEDGSHVSQFPALIDTAADLSAVPMTIIERLQLVSVSDAVVRAFGSDPEIRPIYLVNIQVHDRQAIDVEVLGDPVNRHIILGRDILNHFRLVLDGPNQRLELE